jgi:hypothetical protein
VTAQLVGTDELSRQRERDATEDDGREGAPLTDALQPTPARPSTAAGRLAPLRWVFLPALLAALTLLTAQISAIAALTLLVLAWGYGVRRQLGQVLYENEPHDQHRRFPAP